MGLVNVTAELRMHRYSEEDVAAVVRAAVAELRNRRRLTGAARTEPDASGLADAIREIRAGVMPRKQYEQAAGPDDPPYASLPAARRDEDELTWMITQALTPV